MRGLTGLTPGITAVTVVAHGALRLTFADGLAADVDVLDRMRGPIFAQARTLEGFAKVAVDPETVRGPDSPSPLRAPPPLSPESRSNRLAAFLGRAVGFCQSLQGCLGG
jgi:hypothetical protein